MARFIVFEGLDSSGKTSVIEKIMESQNDAVYNKGLVLERVKRPSCLLFSLDLVYQTRRIIGPELAKGNTVLQDRYWMSVYSYLPDCERWYNRMLKRIVMPFYREPDVYIYLKVSLDERLRRLSLDADNPYHKRLIEDPQLIAEREEKYMEIYESLGCRKYIFDTTDVGVDELAEKISAITY